jgi:hypothetical protein
MLRVLAYLVGLSVLAVGVLADAQTKRNAGNTFVIEDISTNLGYLRDENILLGYVAAGDWAATRRHSWNLWAAMTAPSKSSWNGQRLPVWLTWYSVAEVYGPGPKPPKDRDLALYYHRPIQAILSNPVGNSPSSSLFAFVKYNRAAAEFVWQNEYHKQKTLVALQARFDKENRPTDERTIKPFPRQAIATKPVFWLVKNSKSPQSQRGLTVLPYWDPEYPPPADGKTPDHRTWTKCVAVDPDRRYPEGSIQEVAYDGKKIQAKVVYLDRFFSIPLRDNVEVAAVKTMALELSSAGGEQERMITDPNNLPEIGDHIILLAMHVTTKEIDSWTFQTFWWLPDSNDPTFGYDRPSTVKGVWRNYVMCNAWSMESPRLPDGALHICFNPYLEADLGPTKPYVLDGKTLPPDPMAGTKSNCMNCHNRAGYPAFSSAPGSANMGQVANDGYRPPNDPYFSKMTKTDFLWSIPLHAGK